MDLFSPATVPFSAALLLLMLLVAAEVIGVLIGLVPSALLDSALPDVDLDGADVPDIDGPAGGPGDADLPQIGDTPGGLSRFLGWLSVGKVPVLVLLMAFLAAFGLIGLAVQGLSQDIIGAPLPVVLASAAAFFLALYPTRWLGRGLAAVFPKEHSEAASAKSFVGRIATITTGTARRGLPAEAKLSDQFGKTHYVRVEPDLDDVVFTAGSRVLLTSQVGATFRAIEPISDYLNDEDD